MPTILVTIDPTESDDDVVAVWAGLGLSDEAEEWLDAHA